MTDTELLRLTRLLASRLCHDLISPVAAVNNGLELASEGGGLADDEAFDLIGSSAQAARDRLQYYRVAYGYSGGSGQAPDAMLEVLRPVVETARVKLAWTVSPGLAYVTLPIDTAQVVLNAVPLAAEFIPRGGEVAVSLDESAQAGKAKLSVSAVGDAIKMAEGVIAVLSPQATQTVPEVRTVGASFVKLLCTMHGATVGLTTGDTRMDLTIDGLPAEEG